MKLDLVLSCEHGGNHVPARYRGAFAGKARLLASHAGWDPGAAVLARQLARALDAPLVLSNTTRLLVDANRSAEHADVFSPWIRELPPEERERILGRYWRPHREAVEACLRARGRGAVLHVSVHSFTPRWKGVPRAVDVALLYDPARERELAFADAWLATLGRARADLRLRRNQPYRGTSDGLTTHLRGVFSPARYLGVELEVSQRFPAGDRRLWTRLREDLLAAFRAVLER